MSINVVLALRVALGRGPCRVFNSDAAARLSPTRYTYPDGTVTCDERDRGGVTEIQAPRVVVEVLSPDSTEGNDRGDRFRCYRACPTMEEYVLVSTTGQAVEVYRRTAEGWGTFQVYGLNQGRGGTRRFRALSGCESHRGMGIGEDAELRSIDVRFPVAALYELTEVPEILEAEDAV